jgi:hypothetical protein
MAMAMEDTLQLTAESLLLYYDIRAGNEFHFNQGVP